MSPKVSSMWADPVVAALERKPWLHWGFVYAFGLVFFFCDRMLALDAIVRMYGLDEEDKTATKLAGIALGTCEDFFCLTYMVALLWIFDWKVQRVAYFQSKKLRERLARFVVYLGVFVMFTAPFVANGLLERIRQMRFTLKFVKMYWNERDAASGLEVSPHERNETYETALVTALVSIAFGAFSATWIDLSQWDVTQFFLSSEATAVVKSTKHKYEKLELGEYATDEPSTTSPIQASQLTHPAVNHVVSRHKSMLVVVTLVVLVLMVILPTGLLEVVQHHVSPAVAMVALNTTLSDIFRMITGEEFVPEIADGTLDSVTRYLDTETEVYTLAKDDVLYRRTTEFKGELVFNVSVDPANPPNVVVVVVESFRYHDSQYLVGNNTYLLAEQNITVTPNFDRWAKRGVAFRNFWSGWQTSRSLESILFGQLPYASITETGTTTGHKRVKLAGMPQFFKAKGYEPTFTTGCRIDYDQWSSFLPSHGFDDVLDQNDFKRLAEADFGVKHKDWELQEDGGKARAMSYWGVHDDIAFDVLGNILVNKTKAQTARKERNEPKVPFFVNHYTISSHTPYEDRPAWYDEYPKPDFSALYENEKSSEYVKNYLEMRYFQDMALGKFLDRMDKEGVLKDTIVVVVGDHGQGPEYGKIAPEYREISSARVAAMLIAEGRLGQSAGLLVDDVAEQYDLLNTIMDIVGLPEEGFVQDGIGRSLKRKPALAIAREHVIWSNNPVRKMSVVRGHQRLQYDAIANSIALHDTDKDHDLKHDLFPALSALEQAKWLELRDAGRKVSAYYKKRWEYKCLLETEC
uniref:Sulfatase N-terminal domain-containing protein n=1 Tax=Globisporangium ultimum (strain ATCC 200006 / CBS 805.95 / DAOM BR144) TaxID=431595 RepID=K3X1R6_GLOUD